MRKRLSGAAPAALFQPIYKIQAPGRARLFCLALLLVGVVGLWAALARQPAPASPEIEAGSALAAPEIQPAAPTAGVNAPVREYLLQGGTPAAIPNFVQPDQGCAWAGIGGQVFDLAGQPVSGMLVKVSGVYQGQPVTKVAVTNSSQAFGPGGYDIYLGSQPQASRSLVLQLVDVTGAARSTTYRLNTYAGCQQNLLVVNLREHLVTERWYLPLAGRP